MKKKDEKKEVVLKHLKEENGFINIKKRVEVAELKPKVISTFNPKFESAKKYSIYAGISYSVVQGSGEYFISPFIIKLGATNFQVGLLSSLSSLFSSLSQLISADISDKLKSRKKIVLWSMLFQALIWIPLILNALFFKSVFLTIILFSIYAFSGSMLSAPYMSWLGDIVSRSDTGSYFGLRSKLIRLGSFITTLLSGFLLNHFFSVNTLLGFAVLFSVAFFARLLSYHFIKKMYEPPLTTKKEHYFSFFQFVRKMRYSNFGIFVLYLFFLQLSVSIASPYFTPYLLKSLKLSYQTFVSIDLSMAVAMFLTLEAWGKLSDKIGNKRIMVFNAFIISSYPLLWLLSSNHIYLSAVNFVSGVAWAGFALSSSNYIYDAVTAEKRTRCIAYSNFFKGIAVVIGAMAGAFLINKVGVINYILRLVAGLSLNKYAFVFLTSGIMRILVSLYFLDKIKDFYNEEKKSTIFAVRFFMSSLSEGIVPTAIITRVKNKIQIKGSKGKKNNKK